MKDSTKIALGLGVATVAGISTAVFATKKISEKIYYHSVRCKAKRFVEDKLAGNKKLLGFVDNLSNDELDSIVDLSKKLKKGRDKVEDYQESLKANSKQMKNRVLSMFEDFR